MKFNKYQKEAMRTCSVSANKIMDVQHGIIGMMTELGELADPYKKCMFYHQEIDIENMKEELGDILWYLSLAATALGLKLEDIAKANIDKLNKRYPQGFSDINARERADKTFNNQVSEAFNEKKK